MLRNNYEISNVSGFDKLRFTKCRMPATATSDGGNFLKKWVGLAPGVNGTILKWGGPGPGNENFLAELSQNLVFLHICLSEVDGPVPSRLPSSSIYDCYPVAKSRQDHHGSQSE